MKEEQQPVAAKQTYRSYDEFLARFFGAASDTSGGKFSDTTAAFGKRLAKLLVQKARDGST